MMPMDPLNNGPGTIALYTHPSKTGTASSKHRGPDPKLEQACKDFESLFIAQMMKEMRRTVPQDDMFGGGNTEKLYTSMLDGELSKSIARQRGIGLAPALIRQLSELAAASKNKT